MGHRKIGFFLIIALLVSIFVFSFVVQANINLFITTVDVSEDERVHCIIMGFDGKITDYQLIGQTLKVKALENPFKLDARETSQRISQGRCQLKSDDALSILKCYPLMTYKRGDKIIIAVEGKEDVELTYLAFIGEKLQKS